MVLTCIYMIPEAVSGVSFGKRRMGLAVYTRKGDASRRRFIVRAVSKYGPYLLFNMIGAWAVNDYPRLARLMFLSLHGLFLITFCGMFTNQWRLCIHDMIAGTAVDRKATIAGCFEVIIGEGKQPESDYCNK